MDVKVEDSKSGMVSMKTGKPVCAYNKRTSLIPKAPRHSMASMLLLATSEAMVNILEEVTN